MPVTFHAEVHGVKRLLRLEVRGRVVVVAERADRQRRYGERRRQHRVVRRQGGEAVGGEPAHRAHRQPELRPADGPAARRPATG